MDLHLETYLWQKFETTKMKNFPKILIIDDDRTLAPLLAEYLEGRGLSVAVAHSGDEGLRVFAADTFDLCILDVKMPLKDGFAVAAEIRALAPTIPFIFLSGQQQKEDRIKGLLLGAEDYVTKPFSMEEVYLRVGIVLRRNTAASSPTVTTFSVGKFHFDATSRELVFGGDAPIKLSSIETRLLEMFCQSASGVVERDTALRRIWDDDHQLHSRSLNVYVSKLRQYLKQDPDLEILNIHGEGYRLVAKK